MAAHGRRSSEKPCLRCLASTVDQALGLQRLFITHVFRFPRERGPRRLWLFRFSGTNGKNVRIGILESAFSRMESAFAQPRSRNSQEMALKELIKTDTCEENHLTSLRIGLKRSGSEVRAKEGMSRSQTF